MATRHLVVNVNWCLCGLALVEFIILICINASPSIFTTHPINYAYIHMFTAFWISLIFINIYEVLLQQRRNCLKSNKRKNYQKAPINSFDILIDFQLFLSCIQMFLNTYIGSYALIILWGINWIICVFYRGQYWKQFTFKYAKLVCYKYSDNNNNNNDYTPIGLIIFLCVFGIFLLIAPVFQPWDSMAMYIRWYPLNYDQELLIRGVFAIFAGFYLLSICIPYSYYRSFLLFQIVCCWIYSLMMFIDHLNATQGNGNTQHLYGDILAWLVVPFVIMVGMFIHERSPKQSKNASADNQIAKNGTTQPL